MVRMVTGDNVHTASHIAKECGILMEGGLALEGPVFRKMTEEEVIPMLPKLQVSSRPLRPDCQDSSVEHVLDAHIKSVFACAGDGA